MQYVGLGLFYEDLKIGMKFRTVGRTITEADLVNFINCTGMTEVLFTDEVFLKEQSDIKGRPVPGALVYSFAEGLLTQSTMQHTGFAFLNCELKIVGPTVVGDTIHVECEVVEARESKNRPNRGLVRTMNHIKRQDGQTLITYNPLRMVAKRAGGPHDPARRT